AGGRNAQLLLDLLRHRLPCRIRDATGIDADECGARVSVLEDDRAGIDAIKYAGVVPRERRRGHVHLRRAGTQRPWRKCLGRRTAWNDERDNDHRGKPLQRCPHQELLTRGNIPTWHGTMRVISRRTTDEE